MEENKSLKTKEEYINELKSELEKYNFLKNEELESSLKYMKDADIIGFDIDFTLVIYNQRNIEELIYKSDSQYLMHYKNYPDIISLDKNKDFIKKFIYKDILIDLETGNILKLDGDKKIVICYHGKKLLTSEEINTIYKDGKYNQFNKDNIYNNYYRHVIDSFFTPIIPLFLLCVDLFDKGILKLCNNKINKYEDIVNDILDAKKFNFGLDDFQDFKNVGFYYPEIYKHPKKYLYKYKPNTLLDLLKQKGKKLFFATNSGYSYGKFVLEYTIGKNFTDYFDLCFFKSSKPLFFNYTNNRTIFEDKTEINRNCLDEKQYDKIIKGEKIFIGGSYKIVEDYFRKLLDKKDVNVIFIGDNIGSDCNPPSEIIGWESVFIYDDINLEFIGNNSSKHGKGFIQENEKNEKYINTFSMHFKNQNCILALPNVEGLKYLLD